MNQKDLDDLADVILEHTQEVVKDRFEALEQRIAALEKKPFVKFCGTWESREYAPGDACVHKSALWICKAPTTGAPGIDFIGWQLALKRGDAR